jgi:hypothetical protein
MKALTKLLVLGGATAAAVAGIVAYRRKARAGAQVSHGPAAGTTAAGTMFVGALDEVELAGGLARPMRANVDPESFDPEEVPSEHPEINELRDKMPFG